MEKVFCFGRFSFEIISKVARPSPILFPLAESLNQTLKNMDKSNEGMIIVCVIILILNLFALKYDILLGSLTFIFFGLWALIYLIKTLIESFK